MTMTAELKARLDAAYDRTREAGDAYRAAPKDESHPDTQAARQTYKTASAAYMALRREANL